MLYVIDSHTIKINLILAWLWITLGFVSGAIIGFNFKFFCEDWLEGYSGLKRRLYRLGHISFFGMALINLMFYFTARTLTSPSYLLEISSLGFIVGAITMPICCFTMAHYPKLKLLFYIPVISLIIAGILTLWEVVQQ